MTASLIIRANAFPVIVDRFDHLEKGAEPVFFDTVMILPGNEITLHATSVRELRIRPQDE